MTEPGETIFIVDDDPSVLRALTRLLRSAGAQARSYGSATEFIAGHKAEAPGCLVLDVSMPGCTGLELQDWLRQSKSPLPIVFLTGRGDIPTSVRAMKAGAVDFLPKPFREQDLLDAVAVALERDRRQRRTEAASAGADELYATLTERERCVMDLATSGLMNKQIAFELGLSEITVKIRRGKIMRKMQAKTFADLVRMAEKLRSAKSPK